MSLSASNVGEGSLALTDAGRHDQQVVFVDEAVVQQRPIQRGDAVFHDVPAALSLKRGEFFCHIPFEKRRIPGNLIERCRCHELLQPIDPAYVCVSRNGRPDGSKGFVGDAAEKEELDVVELPKRVLGALVIEES